MVDVRYAAIGDSFTEGVGDEGPDGIPRGWADRVAAGLAGASGEQVSYVNTAVRGRLLADVVGRQLDEVLALDPLPDLITLNGGGNDMLRPRTDGARLAALTEQAVARCADAGVRVVLLSGADPSGGLPFGSVVHRRAEELTVAVRELAARRGLTMVDAFGDDELRRPGYWSDDRLHLNPAGHLRVAGLVLRALGVRAAEATGRAAAVEPRTLSTQLAYYRRHVLPWVGRRLRGRSSGDHRPAKYPSWTPIPAAGDPAR
ncbi:SGNH/GDSL hydrolase family protein [Pseudonocardia phyllosphaerae]|uniref:SGNH/GDSL hydrolase family protein n=1 Tax=Pseudonocardia phyllosphaerae TaxID=3390502 RepID=UPI00397DDEF3